MAMTVAEVAARKLKEGKSCPPGSLFLARDTKGAPYVLCSASFMLEEDVKKLGEYGALEWVVEKEHLTSREAKDLSTP